MRALVVVDIQNDFMPNGALPVAHSDQVIPVANGLMDKFDLVVAVRDSHPPNHCSFATTHGREPGDTVIVDGMKQNLWPVHCVTGTKGAAFANGLRSDRFAKVFDKGSEPSIDSYGGFYDNGWHRATGLADFLHEKGVNHIFVTGLTTDYCVRATVLDGLKLGFRVSVVQDGIRAVDVHPGDGEKALAEMVQAGAELIQSVEVSRIASTS